MVLNAQGRHYYRATAIAEGLLDPEDFAKLQTLTADLAGKQPLDSDLTTIAGLTATTDNIIQSVSSAWASRTPAQHMLTLPAATGSLQGVMTAAQFTLLAQIGTDSGWTALGFAANWSNNGAPNTTAAYKKDETGRVWLRGLIKKSIAVVANENPFSANLPSGFRPTGDEYFATNSNGAYGGIIIQTSGAILIQVGNAAYVSLAGLSFDTV